MNKKLLSLACLPLIVSLSACSGSNEAKYGPSISRSDAEVMLDSIYNTTSSTSFNLPTAYEATVTVPFFALILIVPRVDKVVYSESQQFYSDVVNGSSYWAFYKDGKMIEAQSVSVTQDSTSVQNNTYKIVTDTFKEAVNDIKPIFSPGATSLAQNALVSRPNAIKARLLALDSDGYYVSGTTKYSVKNEEYRSNGDGNLFIAFKAEPNDDSETLNVQYIFQNNLLIKDEEKQRLFTNDSEYAWEEPKIEYPDLSNFTLES